MSNPLYNVTKELLDLQEIANNAEDVDETLLQAYQDTIESLQLTLEEKAENLINISRNVTSNIESIDNEIKRLQSKKASIKQKDDWFKDKLRQSMQETGTNKISCPLFTITLAKATKRLEVTDEDSLPDDLYDLETKVKPKTKEITERLKAGETIDGAHLIEAKRRLIIK